VQYHITMRRDALGSSRCHSLYTKQTVSGTESLRQSAPFQKTGKRDIQYCPVRMVLK
jgi:hypothetical protein